MPNDKGYLDFSQPMKKTQPAKPEDRHREGQGSEGMYGRGQANGGTYGGGHDFNLKGKVTNTEGSDYHDLGRKSAYLHGNFAEKDSSQAYLKERGMKGQEVRHFAANSEQAKLHTGNGGVTAYNSNPIAEVYTPATGHKTPPPQAVIHSIQAKVEGPAAKDQTGKTDKLK